MGEESSGESRTDEFALEEARISPRIVTVIARVFRGSGRIGSDVGRIITQFSAAPPIMAPVVRAVIGIKREGVLSSR